MATSFSSSSSKSKALGSARSISLPSRSHPTTAKTEEELNKLKSWETTSPESSDAEVICTGLEALSELQKSVDSLLTLPYTIQALSIQEDKKWADELLENSVKILDICAATREIVLQFKESIWDLQSCLRRRKENKYNSFGKKMKQEARRLITSLKKMDQEIWTPVLLDYNVDHHVCAVIRALRESSSMANSVLQKVLVFLSMAVSNSKAKPRPSKWCVVSRLVLHKGAIANSQEEEQRTNKIDELERVGAQLEGIENGLENSFRALIRSRTSLLNVISCH
ncbi:PREDICTED: uncharacterized protein LOC109177557 [Ipomoea nil]|uniref:uncharacterized protein LOC109177557 n=1 Tax=Ipomoea nil TaxID=35883 RepID=UPI0009017DAC|nr:PREDICTED: uncharacterized protein LOC109177557 [Ipomoea nil]